MMGSRKYKTTEPQMSGRKESDTATFMDQGLQIAAFNGSFVPFARPSVAGFLPWYKDRSYFADGWGQPSIWKSAVIESVASAGLVFTSGQIAATLHSYNTNVLGAYIGVSGAVLLPLFMYATAPASGGHINPMITFFSVLVGMCPVSRGVLYMCGQTLGAAVAGGLLAGVWGREKSIRLSGGGCFVDFAEISIGQVFLNEVFSSFVMLYLAYGVGLDPRQAALFGPRLGPLLVGASLGLMAFSSSGLAPGYAGAQMNPSRCFAFGIVRQDMSDQWIWWSGPATASLLIATVYHAIPPRHVVDGRSQSSTTSPTVQCSTV